MASRIACRVSGILAFQCICSGLALTQSYEDPSSCSMSSASEASRRFAYSFYNTASRLMGAKRNILVSPLAVGMSLSMLTGGASGWSRFQILQALEQTQGKQVQENPECLLQAYYGSRFNTEFTFKDVETVNRTGRLRTATRLFGAQNLTFREDFVQDTGLYGMEMTVVPFRDLTRNSERRINGWVHDQTEGSIRQIIKPGTLQNDTMIALTCALYFKGTWATPFTNVTKAKFYLHNGKTRNVIYMLSQAPLKYFSSNRLQAETAEIPYASPDGSNVDASLLLIMPYKNASIRDVDSRLNDTAINEIFSQNETNEIRIQIPKFRLTGHHKLKFFLKRMGVREIFNTKKAKLFDAIVQEDMKRPQRVYVSNTEHKSRFEIDETGTQGDSYIYLADAATPMTAEQNTRTVIFDRAFIFVLYDKFTDSIIYMGRLSDPSRNVV